MQTTGPSNFVSPDIYPSKPYASFGRLETNRSFEREFILRDVYVEHDLFLRYGPARATY